MQLLFMPISDLKFGEKKSVTSCLIWRSGQPMIFVFTTSGQWVHASSCSPPHVRIFSGDREKLENCDPTIIIDLITLLRIESHGIPNYFRNSRFSSLTLGIMIHRP